MKKIIFSQYGRSMVEMLGVLAIIGVLSVGAISGYSKAMMKYKLNKQAEQISWLLNVMYRYKSAFGRNPAAMRLSPYFIKLGEIPENMITDNETLHDVFNSRIILNTNGCDVNGCREVILLYKMTPSEPFEVCQNLFNIAKGFKDQINYMGAYKNNSISYDYSTNYYGSRYCNSTNKCLQDITLEEIDNQCRFCVKGSVDCNFSITYKIND